jgi:hypothetical protein
MATQTKKTSEVTLPALPMLTNTHGAWMNFSVVAGEVLGSNLFDFGHDLFSHAANPSLPGAILGIWQTLGSSRGSSRHSIDELVVSDGMFGLRASNAIETARIGEVQIGSIWPKVVKLLSRAVTHDTESLWQTAQLALQEEADGTDGVERQFHNFLDRYGESGLGALGGMILGRLPSSDVSWSLLRLIGGSDHKETQRARANILAAALESGDAGLRYASASALGEFGGEMAKTSLRKRLDREANNSVRRMISAELGG